MSKSLRAKLVLIMLLLIVILMAVVTVFLTRGVRNFYYDEFNRRINDAFATTDLISALRDAADEPEAVEMMERIVAAHAGNLGIDSGTRKFYILDGRSGARLAGAEVPRGQTLEITPNIENALAGDGLFIGSSGTDYMDAAAPIDGEAGRYIVYIRDNRETARMLSSQLFRMILEAIAFGLGASVVISLLLARTFLSPVRGMTEAAEAMAEGDFSRKIPVESEDEIGTLATTFNTMASQLEGTLFELTQAEQQRREFVANVSHELRTPLTSVRARAEVLAESLNEISEEDAVEFLHVILNESDRMTKIVSDLLDLSRLDSGKGLDFEMFSLEKSVRDVYAAIILTAEQRGQSIMLELQYNMPDIRGDKARIEQVLMNIVTNAIKYTPEGGSITVSCGTAGGNAWVRISDTGVGIPEDDLPHVFDRFYRVDKARSRESGGTGLGLSIAHEIVERHHGKITVASTYGLGSSFTVTLPIRGSDA